MKDNNELNAEQLLKSSLQEQAGEFYQDNEIFEKKLLQNLQQEYQSATPSKTEPVTLEVSENQFHGLNWSMVAGFLLVALVGYGLWNQAPEQRTLKVPEEVALMTQSMTRFSDQSYQKQVSQKINSVSVGNYQLENKKIKKDLKKLARWFTPKMISTQKRS